MVKLPAEPTGTTSAGLYVEVTQELFEETNEVVAHGFT